MSLAVPPFNNGENPVYVYEWKAWSGYLFPAVCGAAIRIEAKIRQSNSGILKKLKAGGGYFLFHINLTKTTLFFKDKEGLLASLKNIGITPLNADINDISKKYLQSICEQTGLNVTRASIEGDPNELLIIKTDFNHGGKPEKRLLGSEFRRLNLGSNDYKPDIMYPVMERKKIKNDVWRDKNLVVEKYIANEQNYFYRVYKLLNKIVISEVIDHDIIKKMPTGIERINYYYDLYNNDLLPGDNLKFNDLVADLAQLSNTINLDFAALDVVKSDEDKYYIIDVNATPNWEIDDQIEILDFLADGLYQKKNLINLI